MDRDKRHAKQAEFIKKAEQCVARKSFGDYKELSSAVYASLVRYLEENETVRERNISHNSFVPGFCVLQS